MKRYTLYYKDNNGNRISMYSYNSYQLAVKAWEKAVELTDLAEDAEDILSWHLMDNDKEKVLM